MGIRADFDRLFEKLKTERDTIKLKLHLTSMEIRKEFDDAEKKWRQIKAKMNEITDEAVQTSDEYILKAKKKGEELREIYQRITKRMSK